jgi:hypothetical protein
LSSMLKTKFYISHRQSLFLSISLDDQPLVSDLQVLALAQLCHVSTSQRAAVNPSCRHSITAYIHVNRSNLLCEWHQQEPTGCFAKTSAELATFSLQKVHLHAIHHKHILLTYSQTVISVDSDSEFIVRLDTTNQITYPQTSAHELPPCASPRRQATSPLAAAALPSAQRCPLPIHSGTYPPPPIIIQMPPHRPHGKILLPRVYTQRIFIRHSTE